MNKSFQRKIMLAAIVSVYTLPSFTYAETLELDDVEVIATTPLKGVGLAREIIPANIQSVKGEEIEKQNNLSIADYLKNSMTGVNVNEVQNNPFQPNVNYRGFSASPLLGVPQGLSVFVDGVRVNEPFGDVVNWDLIPLNAISSMNLIPGSNPVFGLNTLGGAISINTKSGRTDPGVGIELTGGSWGRVQGSAEFGTALDNGIDVFFAATVFHEDGWRNFSPSDVAQGFGKIGWQGENTDMNVSLTLADNQLVGNGFVQKEFLSAQGYETINTKPDATNTDMAFLNFNLNHYFNDDVVFSGNTYYRSANTDTLNGDVNDDVEDDDFVADCTGLDEDDAESACGGALNRSNSERDSYGFTGQLTFSQDLMGKTNQLITGVGYDFGKTRFRQSAEFGNLNADRGVDGLGIIGDEAAVKLTAKTKTWSIFATDTLSLNDMYHLTFSGRYNYTKIDNEDGLTPAGVPESLTEQASFGRFNPAVGLSVTPSKNFSYYASYNEGSRAPTAIEIGCAYQDLDGDGEGDTPCRLPNAMAGDPPLAKVVSKTFEVGARGSLANGLGWSASVYRSQNTDDIQFVAANSQGDGNFQNVGKTRRQGIDFGVNGKFSKFTWNLGYSFIKATYQSPFSIANEVNTSAVDDKIQVQAGDYLAGIPRHQFKFRGEYQATDNWTVGTNIVAFSNQYSFGNENNEDQGEGAKVRGYGVVNFDTQYTFDKTGWKLFAKVNNVFDKEYFSAGMLGETFFEANGTFMDGEDDRSFLVAPGAPRAGWVGLRYDFDVK